MLDRKTWIVIAVDGQAASGKGTISRKIAEELKLTYLDTGKLYRALTYYLVSNQRRHLYARDRSAFMTYLYERRPPDDDLQSEFISRHTPEIAKQKWARKLLLSAQRDFANHVVEGLCGSILDGRDIGTVVCPDADVKLFVVADVNVRARRRLSQAGSTANEGNFMKIRSDLELRDKTDSERKVAPLLAAADAVMLDTSEMTIEQAVARAIELVAKALPK